ncbi:hypothetical protein CICLE_v100013482mg, partial [Citrus x clementina]
MDYTSKQTDL